MTLATTPPPVDSAQAAAVLLKIGTSGFGYKAWKGSFYPEKLPAKQMLNFYGEQFNAVEINYTFRSTPSELLLKSWAADVPKNFEFVLKAPQRITHIRRLKNSDELLADFLKLASTLKKRLGPVLFQLPPNFKKDLTRLSEFLAIVPRKRRVAFEFRHQSWFDDEVFALLRKRKVALCFAEAENDLEIPFVSTADWGYVRLRNPNYTPAELKAWVKKINSQKWKHAYVFFRHEDEGKGPKMAIKLKKLI